MQRAMIVIGKAPVAGKAKTRLVPPLSTDGAAALYKAFLLDAIETATRLGWERTSLIHPRGDGPLMPVVPGVVLVEQPRAGLGDALRYAFERHFADGFETVVLIGSDNPTLPAEPIRIAEAALRNDQDLAIGPTADGGYYLLGMRQPHRDLFEGIEWSTPRVYAQTVARGEALGLRVHRVAEWYDVDEAADLDRLQRDLAERPPEVAPRTRAVLSRLRAQAAPAG